MRRPEGGQGVEGRAERGPGRRTADRHPGTRWPSGGRSFTAPAYGGKLLVWSVDCSGAPAPSPAAPKNPGSGGVGGHPFKTKRRRRRRAPSKTNRRRRWRGATRPPTPQRSEGAPQCSEEETTNGTEGSAAASDAPAAAGAADARLQHNEGSGWSGCRSVSEASARQTSGSPATAPRTATARGQARPVRGAHLHNRRSRTRHLIRTGRDRPVDCRTARWPPLLAPTGGRAKTGEGEGFKDRPSGYAP